MTDDGKKSNCNLAARKREFSPCHLLCAPHTVYWLYKAQVAMVDGVATVDSLVYLIAYV